MSKMTIQWAVNYDLHERQFDGDSYHYACGTWAEFLNWLTSNPEDNITGIWINDCEVWNATDGWLDSFIAIRMMACIEEHGPSLNAGIFYTPYIPATIFPKNKGA